MYVRLFRVRDGDHDFAMLRAANEEEAIRKACEKTDGHDPANCTVRLIEITTGVRPSTPTDRRPQN